MYLSFNKNVNRTITAKLPLLDIPLKYSDSFVNPLQMVNSEFLGISFLIFDTNNLFPCAILFLYSLNNFKEFSNNSFFCSRVKVLYGRNSLHT